MKVKINVTKDHIRYGNPKSGNDCFIQRAIRDALPLAEIVAVGTCSYALKHVNEDYWTGNLQLPRKVEDFITKSLIMHGVFPPYLRWLVHRPFSFELDVPDEFVAKEPVRGQTKKEVQELCAK